MIRSLRVDEVKDYELELDSVISRLPLPTNDCDSAAWYILTTIDDKLRNIFSELVDKEDFGYTDGVNFMFLLNENKYALRHALSAACRRLPHPPKFDVPVLQWDRYTKAGELLSACQEYEAAVRAVVSFRNGGCECLLDSTDGTLNFVRPEQALVGDALEILLTVRDDEPVTHLDRILSWLANADQWPTIVAGIASHTASSDNLRVRYYYNSVLAEELQAELPAIRDMIPPSWSFSWCTRDEARRCEQSLVTRCAYHLVAVDAGSKQLFMHTGVTTGKGVGSLCFAIGKQRLARQVRDLSGVALDKVLGFLDFLTFGYGTNAPDPALQPLVPVDDSFLLIAPLQICSSNIQRNLLSLQARVDRNRFDANSYLFEKGMVRGVEEFVRRRYPHFLTNIHVPNRKQAGEVDLLIADASSRTIMVGEMRWMHATGDAGEVQNRKRVIGEKMKQLEPKVKAVREQVREVLLQLGIRIGPGEANEWLVAGIVIIEGYYGRISGDEDQLVIVPRAVLEIGIESADKLRSLYNWLASRAWLPREELHFSKGTRECSVGKNRILWGGIGLLSSHTQYLEFVKASCLAAN